MSPESGAAKIERDQFGENFKSFQTKFTRIHWTLCKTGCITEGSFYDTKQYISIKKQVFD